MNKLIDLNLAKIADGALQEQVLLEAKKIFANILDPNTTASAKRTMTIKLTFEPDADEREDIKLRFDVASKLAPLDGGVTKLRAGRDIDTGLIGAAEIKSGIPGQTYIDDNGDLRTDTGKKVEEVEVETANEGKVINLQKAKRG